MCVCVCSSREWFDAFDAKVVTLDTWRCGLQDIWRGNIHFTENRVQLTCMFLLQFPPHYMYMYMTL